MNNYVSVIVKQCLAATIGEIITLKQSKVYKSVQVLQCVILQQTIFRESSELFTCNGEKIMFKDINTTIANTALRIQLQTLKTKLQLQT